ncbi:hypothetical protein TCAL_09935 [Tigriopus californicus]|uniref:Uncharacterized protein n=1 Tax=Tigriopus californicus TaxID=6832 RepID=A0A553PST3_TIGCA|nr:uncharacterized protein LOC131892305 [Tigriopus californicus]TRY80747.1 hypothetical protein TCAL_09935 [Tigriopus californicus]|eukprot:TCALIF_09935-PA protein Name:"Protein of unknown function" AED:0.00 eAED:0.00 QI:30/1/1/1/1/1/5/126/590
MSIIRGPLFVLIAVFLIEDIAAYLPPGWHSPPIAPPEIPQTLGNDEPYYSGPSYYQSLSPGRYWGQRLYPKPLNTFYSSNSRKDETGVKVHSNLEVWELEKKEQAIESVKEEIEREKEAIEEEEEEVERKKAIAKQAIVQQAYPGDTLSVSPDKSSIDYQREQELRSRAREEHLAELYGQYRRPSRWEQSKYAAESSFQAKRNSKRSRYAWSKSQPWLIDPRITRKYGSWNSKSESSWEAARRLAEARKYGAAYYGPQQWNNNPSPSWGAQYESSAESESHKNQYEKESYQNHSEVGPNRSLKLDVTDDEVKVPAPGTPTTTAAPPAAPYNLPPIDWRRRFQNWPWGPKAKSWGWHTPTPDASPIHIKVVVETKCYNASAHDDAPKVYPIEHTPSIEIHQKEQDQSENEIGSTYDDIMYLPGPLLSRPPPQQWQRPSISQWRQNELERLWKSTHSQKWGWNTRHQDTDWNQEEPFRWQPAVPKWDQGGQIADDVDSENPDLLARPEQPPSWTPPQGGPFTRPLIQQQEFYQNQKYNNEARHNHQISKWGTGPNHQLGPSLAWEAQQQSHNQQSQNWKAAQSGSWAPAWRR